MEQRINALEEELKVLKNQIKAVLLDIKESLAAGNGYAVDPPLENGRPATIPGPVGEAQATPPPWEGSGPAAGRGTVVVNVSPTGWEGSGPAAGPGPAGDLNGRPETGFPATGLGGGVAQKTEPALRPGKGQAEEADTVAIGEGSDTQFVNLLTVSVLAQWLSRAVAAVGKDEIGKLVEIYDLTGNLPPRLKETMLLLADLCGDGNRAEDTPATDQVPATAAIQLLIELDSLLRYRSSALESVVTSMVHDGVPGKMRASHG